MPDDRIYHGSRKYRVKPNDYRLEQIMTNPETYRVMEVNDRIATIELRDGLLVCYYFPANGSPIYDKRLPERKNVFSTDEERQRLLEEAVEAVCRRHFDYLSWLLPLHVKLEMPELPERDAA